MSKIYQSLWQDRGKSQMIDRKFEQLPAKSWIQSYITSIIDGMARSTFLFCAISVLQNENL